MPAARLPLRAIAVASLVVIVMFAGPIGRWPWDHDEVQSLMELRGTYRLTRGRLRRA